jgi:hypothetical protein
LPQVDDGSTGKFGVEIRFRGQFEACACLAGGEVLECSVARALRERELGWHDSKDGWAAQAEEPQVSGSSGGSGGSCGYGDNSGIGGGKGQEKYTSPGQGRTPSVCIAFEGGPGTVSTVAAAARNRTPALLMYGSGRATDLLCDVLRVFESDAIGERPGGWHFTRSRIVAGG